MNKRQYKKRRKKFLEINDFPTEPFLETQCPYCGFEELDYEKEDIVKMGGSISIEKYRAFFDGWYSGHSWTVNVTCPICKTKYSFEDSNV